MNSIVGLNFKIIFVNILTYGSCERCMGSKEKQQNAEQNNFKWNPNIHLGCVWIPLILLKIKN